MSAKLKCIVLGLYLFFSHTTLMAANAETTSDGLIRVDSQRFEWVYTKPDIDLSEYKQIMIAEPEVAFQRDWEREHRHNVSSQDIARIKQDTADVLLEALTDAFQDDQYFKLVSAAGKEVLLLRPAIIDLNVTAPTSMNTAGRQTTYATSAGAATLALEIYDSVSGEILARVADRQSARQRPQMQRSSRPNNLREARIIADEWAKNLRAGLDEAFQKSANKPE